MEETVFQGALATGLSRPCNIASRLVGTAASSPSRVALWCPQCPRAAGRVVYQPLSYMALDQESDRYAHGLVKLGIDRGCRVWLMIPPGAEFLALSFALFKIGAVMILIDPGMGKGNLLQCIRGVEPEAIIAVPLAHVLRPLYRSHFRSLRYAVTLGRRWFWGGATLSQVRENGWRSFPVAEISASEAAAIVFTTGSTGVPKGVVYSHAMLEAQIESIKSQYRIGEHEVLLAAFAPFALFSVAMGTTCVLPFMDPTKPARVDPQEVIRAVRLHHVTYSFGSPAFWDRVSEYCVRHEVRLPTIKKILMAGAPASHRVLRRLREILPPEADTYTPYGATEALPVTSISGTEILQETAELTRRGAGICVGKPLPGTELNIIKIVDEAIAQWDEALVLLQGEIGEIVVRGAVVSGEYYGRGDLTSLAKIRRGGSLWHRMGDVGYLDKQNRLWFCGRKNHRVIIGERTLYPVQCEAIFNCHPDVARSALVGLGPNSGQRPVIVIEPQPGKMPSRGGERERFIREILDLGRQNALTREINDVLFHPAFPVDYRHNAKILREKLALWAARKIR